MRASRPIVLFTFAAFATGLACGSGNAPNDEAVAGPIDTARRHLPPPGLDASADSASEAATSVGGPEGGAPGSRDLGR